MADSSTVPLVREERGDITEALHRGAAAVVNANGKLIARLGNPDAVYYVRSSGKPFQAMAAAEAGAFEKFKYTEAQIALACGSHSGEAAHIAEVKATMAKLEITEDDLICPVSYPLYEGRRDEMIRTGHPPTRLHHNCSGKHCAMIAGIVARGEDARAYFEPDHPHQKRIVQLLAEMGGIKPSVIQLGVDGCGVPAHALPLRSVALAYARLAGPEKLSPERAAVCNTVRKAMTRYAYLVGGSGRFDTLLLATGGGSIVCKGGALGYIAAGVRSADPKVPSLGLALKIENGNHQAACVAALEVLNQLGVVSEQHRWRLASWHDIPVKDARDQAVGSIHTVFDMKLEK